MQTGGFEGDFQKKTHICVKSVPKSPRFTVFTHFISITLFVVGYKIQQESGELMKKTKKEEERRRKTLKMIEI